jgi:hypothetical protein
MEIPTLFCHIIPHKPTDKCNQQIIIDLVSLKMVRWWTEMLWRIIKSSGVTKQFMIFLNFKIRMVLRKYESA